MSVVIVGGNERMAAQYEEICRCYGCKAKVFCKENGSLKRKMGVPDLLILFTNTVSPQDGHFRRGRGEKEPHPRGQDPFRLQRGAAPPAAGSCGAGPACLKPCWPAMQHPPWQG